MARAESGDPRTYRVVLEWNQQEHACDALVPALPGCFGYGRTEGEALDRVGEAISAHLASLAKHGEPVPPAEGQGPAPAALPAPLGRQPHVTGRVVLAALRRGGFSLDAVAGRQHVLLGAGGRRVPVRVQPGEAVPSGALRRLLLHAGLTVEEFTALL